MLLHLLQPAQPLPECSNALLTAKSRRPLSHHTATKPPVVCEAPLVTRVRGVPLVCSLHKQGQRAMRSWSGKLILNLNLTQEGVTGRRTCPPARRTRPPAAPVRAPLRRAPPRGAAPRGVPRRRAAARSGPPPPRALHAPHPLRPLLHAPAGGSASLWHTAPATRMDDVSSQQHAVGETATACWHVPSPTHFPRRCIMP